MTPLLRNMFISLPHCISLEFPMHIQQVRSLYNIVWESLGIPVRDFIEGVMLRYLVLLFCLSWLTLPPLASLVTMYSWIEFLILAHSTAGSRRRGGAENWNTSLRTSSSRETRSTSSFSVSPRLERCRYANSLCTSRLPDEVK